MIMKFLALCVSAMGSWLKNEISDAAPMRGATFDGIDNVFSAVGRNNIEVIMMLLQARNRMPWHEACFIDRQ